MSEKKSQNYEEKAPVAVTCYDGGLLIYSNVCASGGLEYGPAAKQAYLNLVGSSGAKSP